MAPAYIAVAESFAREEDDLNCKIGHNISVLRIVAVTAAIAGLFLCLPMTAGAGSTAPAQAAQPVVITSPVEVTIPAIGVDADVQHVGLADDGTMGVPVGYSDVAWYDLGVRPGEAGNAIFTGHISSIDYPGVFYNIDDLGPGNTIHVIGGDGTEMVFIVQEVDTYDSDSVPIKQIFAPSTQAGVVLITCGGDWDPVAHLFSNRIVVYATLSSS